jgi:hypothetical protein
MQQELEKFTDSGVYLTLVFVARENISRFEHQLSTTADETERRLLKRMLREEKENLKAAISLQRSANAGLPVAGTCTTPRSQRAE